MGKHIEEKSLVAINEGSIFYRIKRFFRNLFNGKNEIIQPQVSNINNEVQDNEKETFVESLKNSLKNIEDEETKLLKLQKQYDSGNIKVDDLSDSQMKDLIKLYKKQISELSKSNETRKQKLLQYRKRLQAT